MQKSFLWKTSILKIKHEAICNNHTNGGLKNVDLSQKIISLQRSLIKRVVR